METKKLLLVHLSDIHIRDGTENPILQRAEQIVAAIQNLAEAYAAVVFVVSGDVAFSGSDKEYALAKGFFTQLRAAVSRRFQETAIRFVIVPGNHDCDLKGKNTVRTTLIQSLRKGDAAIVDAEFVEQCVSVQKEFFVFLNEFAKPDKCDTQNLLYWRYEICLGERMLIFRCFNTAWISLNPEEQGGLHFPPFGIQRALSDDSGDVSFAVFHHPYNWLPADGAKTFRRHVEELSDFVLTGHEHEGDTYLRFSYKGTTSEYLEGAVLQDSYSEGNSGFHAVLVDLDTPRRLPYTLVWQDDCYECAPLAPDWIPMVRGSGMRKREFEISPEFDKCVNDPGAKYTHHAKSSLSLDDIFVVPNLREYKLSSRNDLVEGAIVEGPDVLKVLTGKQRVLLFGRQQAGKTTLSKVLFREFYARGFTPVLISGDDIASVDGEKFVKLVEQRFKSQYATELLPQFRRLDRERSILIIDDFDHTRLNAKGRMRLLSFVNQRFPSAFVFGDDALKMEELACSDASAPVLADYYQFEIRPFGYLLRSKLVERWFSIGSEYHANPEELAKKAHYAETLITSLLGKSFLPHYPVYILAFLQSLETGTRLSPDAGTYGRLYEVLINDALAKRGKQPDMDLKATYLSEFAFWMFSNRRRQIADAEWANFHADYCAKFKIKPSRRDLKDDFCISGLVEQFDERFRFSHPYAYYYCVARYFRDHISDEAVKATITNLCAKLHKEEYASIWLFLTHLSKDPFVTDVILEHGRKIFSELESANFKDDVSFLKALYDRADEVVLEEKTFGEAKESRLRRLDERPPDDTEFEDTEVETNETLQFIAKLQIALRTLEVMGQLVKNFHGSLVGTAKSSLVKECYSLGLRTIAKFLHLFRDNSDAFVEHVVGITKDKYPDLVDREMFVKRVKGFLFWMAESVSFGLIKRISQAVGHSSLGDVYAEVREELDSNAVALVDMSIKLDNLVFPEDDLVELYSALRDDVFCSRLLRLLVVEHFYLFPSKDRTKQVVCAKLEIPIRKLRGIDVKSQHEKAVAPAAIRQLNR